MNQIQEQWNRTGRLLRKKATGHKRQSIDEMNLKEALDAESKFLIWYDKYPEHEDHKIKKHIYKNYLQPHIEYLKANPPVAKQIQESTEIKHYKPQKLFDNVKYAAMSYEQLKKLEDTTSQWLIFNKNKKKSKEWKDRKNDYDTTVLWMNKKRK